MATSTISSLPTELRLPIPGHIMDNGRETTTNDWLAVLLTDKCIHNEAKELLGKAHLCIHIPLSSLRGNALIDD
jgi:hypothetical protein